MVVANSINEATTGICGFTGTAFTGTAVTNHNLIIGGATSSTLTNVAPSATSGVPVISQGAAADPTFGTAVVAGGGTGITSATAYSVICGGTTTTAAFQPLAALGASGTVLTSNGAGALPSFQTVVTGSGSMVQQVRTLNTTKTQYTSIPAIPRDTTIPQNTEGSEVLTLAITPTNTNNILWIQLNLTGAVDSTTNNNLEICLFQDSTANALETQTFDLRSAAQEGCVYFYFSYFMVAGTTSSTTFKIRLGGQNLGTLTVNGVNNSALYGGTMGTVMTISEIKV